MRAQVGKSMMKGISRETKTHSNHSHDWYTDYLHIGITRHVTLGFFRLLSDASIPIVGEVLGKRRQINLASTANRVRKSKQLSLFLNIFQYSIFWHGK